MRAIAFVVQITELDEAQEEIQRHVSAQADFLESSTNAMAIFGRDLRIKFYNFAFVALWKLDEAWLDAQPTYAEILEARNRVFARHPKTSFVALHVGNCAEDLESVAQNLDRFPNMHVDIAARLNELGRQPRAARRFFDKYQDRIVFGTDATPHGDKFPQQVFNDSLYEIYFRFLETDDEYFDYAPAPTPPQGRWKISGIGLPDGLLHKVYNQNAARLLHVAPG